MSKIIKKSENYALFTGVDTNTVKMPESQKVLVVNNTYQEEVNVTDDKGNVIFKLGRLSCVKLKAVWVIDTDPGVTGEVMNFYEVN